MIALIEISGLCFIVELGFCYMQNLPSVIILKSERGSFSRSLGFSLFPGVCFGNSGQFAIAQVVN